MDPILQTASERIATAYYGDDKSAINPAIITIIMQLIQSLMTGCTPKPALERVHSRPLLTKMRIEWEATEITNDPAEVAKLANSVLAVAQQSSEAELTAFLAALPK